ncbi:MAG: MOSC domain-containing protein [Sedimentisphaerales bacterium]|nr:MOSC domain-containing protein [Sedimentisphaerales bacterium]
MATIKGRIKAISISEKKGMRKKNVLEAKLEVDHGIIGDAHAGKWHRQISLLGFESFAEVVAQGVMVSPGDFAENITTEGINLKEIKVGDRILLGKDTKIEITQIGKKCHTKCEIYKQLGNCVMPKEGLFAKVLKSGSINIGDEIEVIND